MTGHPDGLVVGEYFVAVEGLAMIRNALTNPGRLAARVAEVRTIVESAADLPYSLTIPMTRHEVEDGYTRWAPRYDGPNPAIALEEPYVHALLDEIPPGDALDAACGTGRHTATLHERGHRVTGVDTTEAMLAIARDKVPGADFRAGRLEALPVDDASVDLVTCTLALTHVEHLEPVMQEFARVLRPGGQVILSDIHPLATLTGGIAGFPERDITQGIPYVVNLTHHVGEYVTAFVATGLGIRSCTEPPIDEQMLAVLPSAPFLPEATREAFLGLPYLLIWNLEKGPTALG
jgi:ubiquinone/menaquinone biosynthesis C-methylase UbiE